MIFDPQLGAATTQAQDFFNNLLGRSAGVGPADRPRNLMQFSSTLRLAKFSPRTDTVVGTSTAPGVSVTNNLTGVASTITTTPNGTQSRLLDTTVLPQAAQRKITMAINPKNIKFTQPKRITRKDTLGGTVYYHFTDSQGRNNDILNIVFRGNTGNIDRRGAVDPSLQVGRSSDTTGALAKLAVWHDLYCLTREPVVLSNGTKNVISIDYVSPLIPFVITFYGFFQKVLEFEESADKPFSRDYMMDFIVEATSLPLDETIDYVTLTNSTVVAQPVPLTTTPTNSQLFGSVPPLSQRAGIGGNGPLISL